MSDDVSSGSDRGMDLFDGLFVLLRRWYVVLPVLVATAVVTVLVHNHKTTRYATSAVLALTTPSTTTIPAANARGVTTTTSNSLVANGGLNYIANLVAIKLTGPEVARAISSAAPDASYGATVVSRNNDVAQLPIITLTAVAPDAKSANAAIATLVKQTSKTTTLVQSQAGVPSQKQADAYVLTEPVQPAAEQPSRARAAAAVVVVGVLIAVLLAAITEALASRVRRRRRPAGTRTSAAT